MQVWFGWFLLLGSVYGAPEIWPPNGKLKPNNYIPPTTTPLPKIGKNFLYSKHLTHMVMTTCLQSFVQCFPWFYTPYHPTLSLFLYLTQLTLLAVSFTLIFPTQTMYIVPCPNYVYCTLPKLCISFTLPKLCMMYTALMHLKSEFAVVALQLPAYMLAGPVKICKGVCTVFSPEPFAFYCIFDYSNLRRSLLLKYKAAKSKHIYHA